MSESGTAESGTYLYAVARPSPEFAVADLCGVDGAPVRVVEGEGLCCVVSTVSLEEFGADPLHRKLEDLAWVKRIALEHDRVVQAVWTRATAVPLRMGTVYVDDASALRRIASLREAALATLEVLTDRDELGVKVYAVARDSAAVAAATDPPRSGIDYLRQRRAAMERTALEASVAASDAEEIFDRLCRLAVMARRHRPQDPALSGIAHPMLLNAAFLVDRARIAEFRNAVGEVSGGRPEGAVVLTGPWPPYSFATLDDA